MKGKVMRVWFVTTFITENMAFNDAEPGDRCSDSCNDEHCRVCYQYETYYDSEFGGSVLYATEAQAITERNRLFMESYEKARKGHADRLRRHKTRQEAFELLVQFGLNPEDLYPYGVGEEPEFHMPYTPRVGYIEVVE